MEDSYNIWDMENGGSSNLYPRTLENATAICSRLNLMFSEGRFQVRLAFKEKIICIPLDPSLPILEAGHLQDRQRKLYRKDKI